MGCLLQARGRAAMGQGGVSSWGGLLRAKGSAEGHGMSAEG